MDQLISMETVMQFIWVLLLPAIIIVLLLPAIIYSWRIKIFSLHNFIVQLNHSLNSHVSSTNVSTTNVMTKTRNSRSLKNVAGGTGIWGINWDGGRFVNDCWSSDAPLHAMFRSICTVVTNYFRVFLQWYLVVLPFSVLTIGYRSTGGQSNEEKWNKNIGLFRVKRLVRNCQCYGEKRSKRDAEHAHNISKW